jgi:saccharopine dehydrogenase-like NADP-dependent oxidoreductase
MRNILILGAGKSSVALIDYLVEHAAQQQWQLVVADITPEQALQKTKHRPNTTANGFDINNDFARKKMIAAADIVISMLPASMHYTIALDCLELKKNLVTPSYISAQMQQLSDDVAKCGLVFMNEVGLDPGIDHMSAMQLLDKLKSDGCNILGFESHCGGLIAPESDTNPWHYKFTWNPRNVILAGQGDTGIHYLSDGKQVDLRYESLFGSARKFIVEPYGEFETYPNRDSLKYKLEYGLGDIQTLYRGTLRIPPFCNAWAALIDLGFTDDKHRFDKLNDFTFSEFYKAWKPQIENMSNSTVKQLLLNTLYDGRRIPLKQGSHAQVLQALLEEQWKIMPGDKDMVVMVHQITYMHNGVRKHLQSDMVYIGKDEEHTAMAITVGLPVAMVTKMILNGGVAGRGVLMPKTPEIYNPILAELKQYGIIFNEQEQHLAN